MKKVYGLKVFMRDGTKLEFDDVFNWQLGDYRLLIVLKPQKKNVLDKDGNRKSITFKATELVFLCANILHVETFTEKEISDVDELRKHDAFLARGIDILEIDVSSTPPPNVEEVKKQIMRDQKGLLEENKIVV